jgi:hypothetical protein
MRPPLLTATVLVVFAALVALASAPRAAAHHWSPWACGLPGLPLVAEYAEISVAPALRDTFAAARPPLVLATNGLGLGRELRGGGAHTVFWEMNLKRLVGNTYVPADPTTVAAAADRLYERAVATTECDSPVIALNELQGAWVPTPWSAWNAQYRANVLELARRLHTRGAHPYLLVTTTPRPFTATADAAEWWRQLAEVSDIVLQVHFNGRMLHRRGALAAGRQRRTTMRAAIGRFVALGIPPARLGLLHGFQSGRGAGGREGLPLASWLRVVKWEVLAARQVHAEHAAVGTPLGSDWSWGWGDFPTLSKVDAQKPITACVYLWARNPGLCDGRGTAGRAGVRFNASLTEGSIALPPNVECLVGRDPVPSAAVARFAALRGASGPIGRELALASLFQRVLERRRASASSADVEAAERSIIVERFGGDASAYAAALAAASADVAIARHIIGVQLRRRAIARSLRGRVSFRGWALRTQRRALVRTVCVRDDPPPLGIVDLTRWLPLLDVPRKR